MSESISVARIHALEAVLGAVRMWSLAPRSISHESEHRLLEAMRVADLVGVVTPRVHPSIIAPVVDIFASGIPMTKGSWRIFGRKLVPDNPGEPEWAATIGWLARAQIKNAPPVKARYGARIEFTMPPPVGRQRYRRDLDKLARSAFDALTGIIWTDDEQVDALWCVKQRGDTPGARIIVERIGA